MSTPHTFGPTRRRAHVQILPLVQDVRNGPSGSSCIAPGLVPDTPFSSSWPRDRPNYWLGEALESLRTRVRAPGSRPSDHEPPRVEPLRRRWHRSADLRGLESPPSLNPQLHLPPNRGRRNRAPQPTGRGIPRASGRVPPARQAGVAACRRSAPTPRRGPDLYGHRPSVPDSARAAPAARRAAAARRPARFLEGVRAGALTATPGLVVRRRDGSA